MKSDILRESGVVERIICDLSEYGDIPNKGFLVGGAVANLLMTYLWEGNYPINDLDIFIESEETLHKYTSTPHRTNELVVEGDGYMVTKLSYDHGSNYQILNVERDGLLIPLRLVELQIEKKGMIINTFSMGLTLTVVKLVLIYQTIRYFILRSLRIS